MLTTAGGDAPLYSVDITESDFALLLAFVRGKTQELRGQSQVNSPAHHMARAVERAVHSLELKFAGLAEVDDGSDDVGRAKKPLWDHLVYIAEEWKDNETFDAARWRNTSWVSQSQHESALASRRRELTRR